MDRKNNEKLAKFKQEMQGEEEPAEVSPLTETLDYHEHMEQRHQETGRGVLDAMYGDRKEKVLTWADNIEGREIYKSWAEKIVENKDAYYIAGQKLWLASEDGIHQSNPITTIINGFVDEQLSSENETWRNLRDRNPKGFEELQNRLTVFVGRRMEDIEFTPEDQHVLKFQALQEFTKEGREFGDWATDGRLTAYSPSLATAYKEAADEYRKVPKRDRFGVRYSPNYFPIQQAREKEETAQKQYSESVVRISPHDVLSVEGFIQNDQEWEDVRVSAKDALLDGLSFRRDLRDPRQIEGYYPSSRNPQVKKYKKIFDIAVTNAELLATGHGAKAYEELTGRSAQEELEWFEEKRIMAELQAEERLLRMNREAEKKEEDRRWREEESKLRREIEHLREIEDYPKRIEEGTDFYIMKGDNGQEHIYKSFINPLNPPEGFEMTDKKKEELRENSYFGLFNIFLTDGRLAPGREIQSHHREQAANRYFHAFNYGEHMDELNDYLTARLEELHDNGEDEQAKLLRRRFRQWAQSYQDRDVHNAFSEYRDLVRARERQADKDPTASNVKVWHDTSVAEVKRQILDSIEERDKRKGKKFAYSAHPMSESIPREYGNGDSETYYMPRNVAYERIKALDQWAEFIKQNIPNADLEEAAMVFDPRTDADRINISDGNAYSVIAFNYNGKRCMIAECCGVNDSGAAPGAMKIWMGDIDDRNGWERAFDKTKTDAANQQLCASINHPNTLSDEVMNRETEDEEYIVEGEDVMFRLAFRYFESDGTNKNILRNNAENRQQLADFIGPEFRRPNAEI